MNYQTTDDVERYYANPPAPPQYPLQVKPKSSVAGVVLSFFIPGLGSMVNGNAGVGAVILIMWIISLITGPLLLFPYLVALGMWIWGMIDGHLSAQKWNAAHGIIS